MRGVSVVASSIGDLTEKASPVDADFVEIVDTETASDTSKKVQIGNLPSTSPGGTDGDIQVNASGSFAGRGVGTGLTDDGTNLDVDFGDDEGLTFGGSDEWTIQRDSANSRLEIVSTDVDGVGSDGDVIRLTEGSSTTVEIPQGIFNIGSGGEIQDGGTATIGFDGSQNVELRNGHTKIETPNSSIGTTLIVETSGLSEIKRDSSTRRLKENIQPLTRQDADPREILATDPVTFTHTETRQRGISFIAEDFVDLGLEHGVARDEDGEVRGFVADSRVIDAAQHLVLRSHDDRLAQLEREVGLA